MAKESALPEAVSISILADLLGLTRQRIGQLERAGILTKNADGMYPLTAVKAYTAFLRKAGSDTRAGALNLQDERARLVHTQRLLAQLEYDIASGNVVRISDVIPMVTAKLLVIKNKFLGLPSLTAPRLAMMNDPNIVADFLLDQVNEILEELSGTDERIKGLVPEGSDA